MLSEFKKVNETIQDTVSKIHCLSCRKRHDIFHDIITLFFNDTQSFQQPGSLHKTLIIIILKK